YRDAVVGDRRELVGLSVPALPVGLQEGLYGRVGVSGKVVGRHVEPLHRVCAQGDELGVVQRRVRDDGKVQARLPRLLCEDRSVGIEKGHVDHVDVGGVQPGDEGAKVAGPVDDRFIDHDLRAEVTGRVDERPAGGEAPVVLTVDDGDAARTQPLDHELGVEGAFNVLCVDVAEHISALGGEGRMGAGGTELHEARPLVDRRGGQGRGTAETADRGDDAAVGDEAAGD